MAFYMDKTRRIQKLETVEMLIHAFGHKSGHGKDTFCDMVQSHLRMNTKGKKIIKMSFAAQLKYMFYILYSWAGVKDPADYDRDRKLRHEIIPYFGTNIIEQWIKFGNHLRLYDNDIWINALLKGIQADVLLISDLRFPNEAKCVVQLKGLCHRITNPRVSDIDSVIDRVMDNFTCFWTSVIMNDEDLVSLHKKAVTFAEGILCKMTS